MDIAFEALLPADADLSLLQLKLPATYSALNLQCIAVSGEGLDLYKDYLRGLVEEQPCPPLYELVTMLLHQQDYWAVNFEPEYDGVEVIQAGTIADVMDGIDYSFKVGKRGFFLWKEINNNSF